MKPSVWLTSTKQWVAAALALAACDPSEAREFAPIYAPNALTSIALTEFCPQLAVYSCAMLRPCCAASPYAFDETKCRLVARALCEARRSKAQDLGLVYNDQMAARCVSGMPLVVRQCNAVCDSYVSPGDALTPSCSDPNASDVAYACRMVWHGSKELTRKCDATRFECNPSVPTASSPSSDAGSQSRRVASRVSCTSGACTAQTILQGGESCGACPRCCASGLACSSAAGVCTALYHPVGASCLSDASCGVSAYCTFELPRHCELLPAVGEPCAGDRCTPGAKCDTAKVAEGICTEGKPLGAPCSVNSDCASSACQTVCMPTGIATPESCNGLLSRGAGGLIAVPLPPNE